MHRRTGTFLLQSALHRLGLALWDRPTTLMGEVPVPGTLKTSPIGYICRNHSIARLHQLLYYRSMATSVTDNSNGRETLVADKVEDTEPSVSTHRNRLADERSPYLLQHANNPVDWYPWGEEAFAKAKEENKMIFLSVGYSTCHWCHVMEHESFENQAIANLMNEKFVNIKVDREERPDVDKVYMTFVQATTGGGGWPMSVWLTPDLKPVLGGTYFPPTDRYFGRPGFGTVIKHIAHQWENNQDKVLEQGTRVLDILAQSFRPKLPQEAHEKKVPDSECVDECFSQLGSRYDKRDGGFGSAPKFPQPVNFDFLLRVYARGPESREGRAALDMCLYTLRQMSKGGIHDHVSQGFHRYSTDGFWHVPHFEKMLYDQAQLAVSYFDAYQITRDEFLSSVGQDILQYVSRDLSDQHGGFYSAEDADSLPTAESVKKREGAFCVWKYQEVCDLLGEKLQDSPAGAKAAEVFCAHYDIKPEGNVDPLQDPHDELKMQNVLIERVDKAKLAEKFSIPVEEVTQILSQGRAILYEERQKRPRPHRDTKIVAAWNGLMISGYARGAQVLHEVQYAERALQAARFLHSHMYNDETGQLLRTTYIGSDSAVVQTPSPIPGLLEDYVFVIRGLLDLYEACYDSWCLEWAAKLQDTQDQLFWDGDNGGYFLSRPDDPTIVLQLKDDQDGAEPSPNSVAVSNLIRLSSLLTSEAMRDRAIEILAVFEEHLQRLPVALPGMICGLMHMLGPAIEVVITGSKDDPDTIALLNHVHDTFSPFKVLILADGNTESILYRSRRTLDEMKTVDGKPTAYVCRGSACSLPVTSVVGLDELLTNKPGAESS